MSFQTVLVEIEEGALAALKAAGHVLEDFFISETQKAVAQIKQLPIASVIFNLISGLENHDATGQQKQAIVVAALEQGVEQYKAVGGLAGIVASVKDIAKEGGQSFYNDWVQASQAALKAANDAALQHG